MPDEYGLLRNEPPPIDQCPVCHAKPFEPFMRGQVQRSQRWFGFGPKRDYCAVICSNCHQIVGYESPPGSHILPKHTGE